MNLFEVVPHAFFKPLVSKYKHLYFDCIQLLYSSYRSELSFGIDKVIIINVLEQYFELQYTDVIEFEEMNGIIQSAHEKALAILRYFKDCGWIEEEMGHDYTIKVNLQDYAITIIEAFEKIIKNEDTEFQSLISTIHTLLMREENYKKPYEYILKNVFENTHELILNLKKLNSNIKKRIDEVTNNKSAQEIMDHFFLYHDEIASDAYHRIKTSDNVSYFRNAIQGKLREFLTNKDLLQLAVEGYKKIEQVSEDRAMEELRQKIVDVQNAFYNYDSIMEEIDQKHSKYITSAVGRAKFLLSNANNEEGKVTYLLKYLADEINYREQDIEEFDEDIYQLFSIFPQSFLDNGSLYVTPISKKINKPTPRTERKKLSNEDREKKLEELKEQNRKRFSQKNIESFIMEKLQNEASINASNLPLDTKRDFIRLIFVHLYGHQKECIFQIKELDELIIHEQYRIKDFIIERRMKDVNRTIERSR